MSEEQTNWSGNYRFHACNVHHPNTTTAIQEIVRQSSHVKAVGTRHSFNAVADSTGDQISLSNLNRVLFLDREKQTVIVEGGIRYGDLALFLHNAGFALPNMASLPHISVAGACATATHGSGNSNGNLATAVCGMEIVTGDGEIITLERHRDGDRFLGAVVGLGALGVVTKLVMDIEPTYKMRQTVYQNLPMSALSDWDAITASAYSVSVFTDWQKDGFSQVWFKERVSVDSLPLAPSLFGMTRATMPLHPIAGVSAENCTEQMGVAGAWHERLPHFRMGFTPSRGDELQSEYFVPRQYAADALRAVSTLKNELAPLLLVSEIRTVAADTLWMSPCYDRASTALHFTWKNDMPSMMAFLPRLEACLTPFEPRPHWGKLFTISPCDLISRYSRLPDFLELVRSHDPKGVFQNGFLTETFALSRI